LTVKFRTGWKDVPKRPSAWRGAEEARADAVTFHPRVAPDRRAASRIGNTARVKQLNIPVFGTGMFGAEGCLRMLGLTGCDGVRWAHRHREACVCQWTAGFEPAPRISNKRPRACWS
jgi:tRNA-dihydrouridine synthase